MKTGGGLGLNGEGPWRGDIALLKARASPSSPGQGKTIKKGKRPGKADGDRKG